MFVYGAMDIVSITDAADRFYPGPGVESDQILNILDVTEPPTLNYMVASRVRNGL